ncbi:MAG: 30S ribosomal protein S19e [Nanoarchaeota archaeon]|nr:30S ribosomal protein S19e [Nanoarchaeota archaeon]
MAILRDAPINDIIEAITSELKKIKTITAPEWAVYVKTGMHKERPPMREDWWYVRAAAVLKSVDKLGPIGVSKLRTKYGGKKNRGHKPERFYKGSGNILRKILQQLEKSGLVKHQDKTVHKGKVITPAGKKMIIEAMKEAKKIYSKRESEKKAKVETARPQEKPESVPNQDISQKKEVKQDRPEKVQVSEKPAEKNG